MSRFTECNGTHNRGAVCWLCSDAKPWWREARIQRGLPADPPRKQRAPVAYVPVEEHYCDCGSRILTDHKRCWRCRHATVKVPA